MSARLTAEQYAETQRKLGLDPQPLPTKGQAVVMLGLSAVALGVYHHWDRLKGPFWRLMGGVGWVLDLPERMRGAARRVWRLR